MYQFLFLYPVHAIPYRDMLGDKKKGKEGDEEERGKEKGLTLLFLRCKINALNSLPQLRLPLVGTLVPFCLLTFEVGERKKAQIIPVLSNPIKIKYVDQAIPPAVA